MCLISPIVGVVIVGSEEQFESKHPSSYKYETIGGNNSRIALQELMEDNSHQFFKTRMAAVYIGLSDDLALRLVPKYNKAIDFTHSMTTQDMVMHIMPDVNHTYYSIISF